MSDPKFLQIAGGAGRIYALDREGRVWVYDPQIYKWRRLPDARVKPNDHPEGQEEARQHD